MSEAIVFGLTVFSVLVPCVVLCLAAVHGVVQVLERLT